MNAGVASLGQNPFVQPKHNKDNKNLQCITKKCGIMWSTVPCVNKYDLCLIIFPSLASRIVSSSNIRHQVHRRWLAPSELFLAHNYIITEDLWERLCLSDIYAGELSSITSFVRDRGIRMRSRNVMVEQCGNGISLCIAGLVLSYSWLVATTSTTPRQLGPGLCDLLSRRKRLRRNRSGLSEDDDE